MSKTKEVMEKEQIFQAVIVMDNFEDAFVPITNETALALLPVVNQPMIDYTLEFLALGGINETFLFCSSHVGQVKEHISRGTEGAFNWSLNMKVHVLVSESCRSFGDCLRDLDAKGLIRGSFVLVEAGAVSNIKLKPLIKQHNERLKVDKGAAITLIYQQSGTGYMGRCPSEEVVIASDSKNRILYHKKIHENRERKIYLPLDILVDNPTVSLRHDLKDTRISICSSSVLPLFSDNFDFQTRDDFIRGLLMNEEIMGSTIYWHLVKGNQFGGTIRGWRSYQAISYELINHWAYPILPPASKTRSSEKDVVLGENVSISDGCNLKRCVLGDNVKIGANVTIQDSFIFSNTTIGANCKIMHSVIDTNCSIKNNCSITAGSIIGRGVELKKGLSIEDTLLQSNKPDFSEENDKLGEKAYKIVTDEAEDVDSALFARRFSRLHIADENADTDSNFEDFRDSEEEELSYTQTPPPDDTKLFFVEVIDSLTRGFEDKLQCDNLILEINSSRYAYNVTVKEVNFNVVKAILIMSLRQQSGQQYYSHLQSLLQYFSPILKNYIKNEEAMYDCLQAVEDVAVSNEDLNEKWVMFVLNWLYDKDHVSEDVILNWYSTLDKSGQFHVKVKPFADWLEEAEEASSEEED